MSTATLSINKLSNNSEPSKKLLREFGFVFGTGILAIFGVIRPLIASETFPLWPWYFFGIFTIWALLAPMSLSPIFKAWMKFGTFMGGINSRIILSVMFYLVVWPMGFIMQLAGRDPMMRTIDSTLTTYRVPSKKLPLKRMEKPY